MKPAKRELEAEIAEAKTLQCRSCTEIVLAPGYCRQCAAYWKDVDEGLWDSPAYV